MQLKVESDSSKNTQERNCTSSVYISSALLQNVVSEPSLVASGSAATKPVLTIQVNQNNSQYNENANSNSGGINNLVNIVSCFRAYPTITAHGIENVALNNSSVSVNRSYCNDESVNNENNQNIVNVECRQAPSTPIKREDLNEISVDVTNGDANVNSNVDYQNMALDSVTARDHVGLIGSERDKIVIGNASVDGTAINPSSDNLINQITIVSESGGAKDSQREQRRRDRRERRQARQRAAAQHGHHRHRISSLNAAAVHQRAHNNRGTMVNGAEQASSRATYEMLPDIINNHLPPPYTTLPHHQLPQPHPVTASALHSPPPIIAAAPVIVDDCRFSFPIPIIRR